MTTQTIEIPRSKGSPESGPDTLRINEMPSETWHWLGVNDTRLPWGTADGAPVPPVIIEGKEPGGEPIRLRITPEKRYESREVRIRAAKDCRITVIMEMVSSQDFSLVTELNIEENARVRLVQVHGGRERIYNTIRGDLAEHGSLELYQLFPGQGSIYDDCRIDLAGDNSSLLAEIGYLGAGRQVVDINFIANHLGRSTESRINAGGALKDAAQKIFRGTIDLRRGSSGAVGSEQETVLLLGDDVRNRTVPVILCTEENVEGTHGATIGELDEETLFYFESRGIGREEAENIMGRAALERVARLTEDPEVAAKISDALKEVH